jgi:glycosyltransferase involved in cell wall biosynthesis
MNEEVSVEFIAKIGEESGIGNYATKLYYALEDENIELVRNDIDWQFPVFSRFPALNRKLQNFIEVPYKVLRSDAEVVYLPSQRKTSGLFLLPKRSIGNVVATVHDMGPYVNDYMGKPTQFLSHFYVRAVRKLENIIAISRFTEQELVEEIGVEKEKITTIYQGVDQEYFRPVEDEKSLDKYGIEKPYVMFIGTEIPRKNLEAVMERFSDLKEEHPGLTLVNVGEAGSQKYREKTLEAMKENNLEKGEDVKFTGFVDEEDLPAVYTGAEATLLFSHYEGLGRSLLESLSCGTPVLANDIAPMNEILPEEMLVDPEDAEEFLEKYENRTQASSENRELIKEYTWKRTAKETVEVFKDAR